MAGFSTFRREQAEREVAERLARAIILEALDGTLTFARRERLAAVLSDREAGLLASLAGSSRTPHSLRAIASDLEYLMQWCRDQGLPSLPFPPEEELLLRFLESQQMLSPIPSRATLKRRISSWGALTRAANGDDAIFSASILRSHLGGRAPVRQKTQPLGNQGLALLLSTCAGNTLPERRDRALLLTAFTLGLRPGEITGLTVSDFIDGKKPALRVGQTILPLQPEISAAIRQWLAAAELDGGPLFRPVDRWGKAGRLGITPQSLRLIVLARGKAAGLDNTPLRAGSLR